MNHLELRAGKAQGCKYPPSSALRFHRCPCRARLLQKHVMKMFHADEVRVRVQTGLSLF